MDGQLCYQADVDRLRDNVVDKKKIVSEGLVFLLDYNENRMVQQSFSSRKKKVHNDHAVYFGTVGKGSFYKYENDIHRYSINKKKLCHRYTYSLSAYILPFLPITLQKL